MNNRYFNICLLGAMLSTFLIIHEPWAMKLTRSLIALAVMFQLQQNFAADPRKSKLANACIGLLAIYSCVAFVFTLIDFKAELTALLS